MASVYGVYSTDRTQQCSGTTTCDKYWISTEPDDKRSTYELARIINHLVAKSNKQYIIQDIVSLRRYSDYSQTLDIIQRNEELQKHNCRSEDSFVAIFYHDQPGWQHFHIYHLCSYRKSYCTCSILNGIEFKKNSRRKSACNSFAVDDWLRLFLYYMEGSRRPVYVKVGRTNWNTSDRVESISQERFFEGEGSPVCLEGSMYEIENLDASRLSVDGSCAGSGKSSLGNVTTLFGRCERKNVEDIVRLIQLYPMSPIENIFLSEMWCCDRGFLNVNVNGNKSQQAIMHMKCVYQ